jgi:hypothetical protein
MDNLMFLKWSNVCSNQEELIYVEDVAFSTKKHLFKNEDHIMQCIKKANLKKPSLSLNKVNLKTLALEEFVLKFSSNRKRLFCKLKNAILLKKVCLKDVVLFNQDFLQCTDNIILQKLGLMDSQSNFQTSPIHSTKYPNLIRFLQETLT